MGHALHKDGGGAVCLVCVLQHKNWADSRASGLLHVLENVFLHGSVGWQGWAAPYLEGGKYRNLFW